MLSEYQCESHALVSIFFLSLVLLSEHKLVLAVIIWGRSSREMVLCISKMYQMFFKLSFWKIERNQYHRVQTCHFYRYTFDDWYLIQWFFFLPPFASLLIIFFSNLPETVDSTVSTTSISWGVIFSLSHINRLSSAKNQFESTVAPKATPANKSVAITISFSASFH